MKAPAKSNRSDKENGVARDVPLEMQHTEERLWRALLRPMPYSRRAAPIGLPLPSQN